jgi:hypothetical protein
VLKLAPAHLFYKKEFKGSWKGNAGDDAICCSLLLQSHVLASDLPSTAASQQ